jgi:hypothetical protein
VLDDCDSGSHDWSGELNVVKLAQQRHECKMDFESREMRPGTEMFAYTEREMFVRIAPHVEPVRISEDCVMTIGRR